MRTAVIVILAGLCGAASARAVAPQPTRAVDVGLYAGRWYEIARTPNAHERHCAGATSDFSNFSGASFAVVETCHARGAAKVTRAKAVLLPGARNAKFKMGFMGGLIHQEYWILDTAPGGAWAIMATPGGNYVWLLGRRARLTPSLKRAALTRIAALGYRTSKLEFP